MILRQISRLTEKPVEQKIEHEDIDLQQDLISETIQPTDDIDEDSVGDGVEAALKMWIGTDKSTKTKIKNHD